MASNPNPLTHRGQHLRVEYMPAICIMPGLSAIMLITLVDARPRQMHTDY